MTSDIKEHKEKLGHYVVLLSCCITLLCQDVHTENITTKPASYVVFFFRYVTSVN